ncbi:MAG: DUF29 family protein [Nostocales cyanobacterium LE14-WE4]|jgi:hypothetical protein|nr:DUF29 domain-containing protein [Anabaena sp. 49633_E8]MDJ0502166.1 DUF29 family protein [Nostocales cyanobacterium LE14-WE4]
MNTLYNSDFYGWTKTQAQLLREEKWETLDKLNLIEEIETSSFAPLHLSVFARNKINSTVPATIKPTKA